LQAAEDQGRARAESMHLVDDDNILTDAQISSKTTKSDMPSDEKAAFEKVDLA